MDISKLNRRERRHYRKIINGKIVYTDGIDIENNNNQNITSSSKTDKKSLDLSKGLSKESNISPSKNEIIKNVLNNISEVINPDVDVISQAIYTQLKNSNIDIEKKTVISSVNKHYRSSQNNESKGNIVVDKDKLGLIVDDIYSQIEIENKMNKINESNQVKTDKNTSTEVKTDSKKNIDNEKSDNKGLDENKKKSNKPSPEKKETTQKKKETSKNDLFSEIEEDEEITSSDDEDVDDLGLKF